MLRRTLLLSTLLIYLVPVCIAGKAGISAFQATNPATISPPSPANTDNDSVIFWASFDTLSGMNNWTTADLTDPGPTWHRSLFNHYNGNSWWSGEDALGGYDNNWLQYLESPAIDLSNAVAPVLTFKVFWAVESPDTFEQYDGWDGCNVWIFNGFTNTWNVLQPEYPAYTCNSLYSFGWFWEMGPGIPGWAGNSSGWINARFVIPQIYCHSGIKIRFAFGSDASTCTVDNPALTGFFLDDILLADGGTPYISNNGDGIALPQELSATQEPPHGNYWVVSNTQYHSPSHSWNCDDRHFLSDAVISPSISIPANMSTKLSYWVYPDMPDYNGDHDAFLDDYYYIEVAPVGSAVWTPIAYDYERPGDAPILGHENRGNVEQPAYPESKFNALGGQTVKIRFRTVTDGNDDGGNGTGIFLDDVVLISHPLPNNDVGAYKLIVPFPTYAGQGPVTGTVQLINYGLQNQTDVPAFWSVDGNSTPFIPWSTISAGDTITRVFNWISSTTGLHQFRAYTGLLADQDSSNDTCTAGQVEITPVGTFELGYDHRQITYLPASDMNPYRFPPGYGAMTRFTPAEDGLPGDLHGSAIKAMFDTTGTFTLHLYADGQGVPGQEVFNRSVTIDESSMYPNWAMIDITQAQYLQGGHPNFWVWLEVTSPDSMPYITGYLKDTFNYGHFYTTDGEHPNLTVINFNVRSIMTGTASAINPIHDSQPSNFTLLPVFPNPFNPTTMISYQLPMASRVSLKVYDTAGRLTRVLLDAQLPPGLHQMQFDGGDLASGIYLLRLQAGEKVVCRKMVLLK